MEPEREHDESGANGLLISPFDRIRERLPQLPRQQYRLAKAILENPETFAFGSVRAVSNLLHVNNATIVRFAQSLGYSGYQGLQAAVRQAYLRRAGLQSPRNGPVSLSSPGTALGATLTQQQTNLEIARRHLDETQLDRICDLLIGARRILVCASGSAGVVATLFARLLRHVGLHAEVVPPAGVDQMIALHDVGSEDVVLGAALWLTFREEMEALDLARRQGAKTVAVVDNPAAPLVSLADHVLVAPAQGAALSFSVVASVAVIEGLISHLAGRFPERTLDIDQALHDLYVKEGMLAPLPSLPEK